MRCGYGTHKHKCASIHPIKEIPRNAEGGILTISGMLTGIHCSLWRDSFSSFFFSCLYQFLHKAPLTSLSKKRVFSPGVSRESYQEIMVLPLSIFTITEPRVGLSIFGLTISALPIDTVIREAGWQIICTFNVSNHDLTSTIISSSPNQFLSQSSPPRGPFHHYRFFKRRRYYQT